MTKETKAKFEERSKKLRDETRNECKILFQRRVGFECGYGWYQNISDLCYSIEALNVLFYKKYGVKVIAEQIKEKFGTLRFYQMTIIDTPKMYTFMSDGIESFCGFIEKMTKTKNVISVVKRMRKIGGFLDFSRFFKPSNESYIIQKYVDTRVEEMIRKCEDECENVCEECGTQIGTDWSPKCETCGWIKYICEDCANESKQTYEKCGRYYRDGVRVPNPREASAI